MAITRGNMRKQIEKPPAKKKRKLLKKGSIPEKYLAGLSSAEKSKRRAEIQRNAKKSAKDPSAYSFATDFTSGGKRRKTKLSKHTKAYRKKYDTKKG
tara:strand:+ start:1080 stop:1370 length:291 start_codon:yes stop_codon:yes gene_type:complete